MNENPPQTNEQHLEVEQAMETHGLPPSKCLPTFASNADQLICLISKVCHLATWHWDLTANTVSFTSADEQLNFSRISTWEQILSKESHTLLINALSSLVTGPAAYFSVNFNLRAHSGSAVPVSCHGQICRHAADGTPEYAEGLIQLIENRSEPPCMSNDAHASDAERTRFMANMSHEIRTPINGILGMTELALETQPNTEQMQYLQRIRSSSKALLRVLDDILDYSKAENCTLTFESKPLSIRRIVKDVLDLFVIDAFRKELDFACWIDPALPDPLIGDAGRIRQILLNLVGNSVKFTHSGEVVVRVFPAKLLGHKPNLTIEVIDTGIGIPAERLFHIFSPFVQVDCSSTRQTGGTGLGLAICKSLAEGLGGSIRVQSTLGKGSTFSVNLPLVLQFSGTIHETNCTPSPCLMSQKILVSTAKPATARTLLETLNALGYKQIKLTTTVQETQKALEDACAHMMPFALWFLDTDIAAAQNHRLMLNCLEQDGNALTGCILMSNVLRFGPDTCLCEQFKISSRLQIPAFDVMVAEAIQSTRVRTEQFKEPGASNLSPPLTNECTLNNITANRAQRRALVVDDDPTNLEVLKITLERSGYMVNAVENGAKALHEFDHSDFDIIILDIQMPVMDGISMTEAIRMKEMRRSWSVNSLKGFTPIIGLTADVQTSVKEAAIAAGMNTILAKPITRKNLLAAIERVLSEEPQNSPDRLS
jgi:two-component system sensor histidine kinase/response regulator